MAAADVVVYDALANPRLLARCPTSELVYVGKRAASHSMTQDQINAVLIEHGRRGKRVVRLKGGDPFVFGRGRRGVRGRWPPPACRSRSCPHHGRHRRSGVRRHPGHSPATLTAASPC